MKAILTNWKKGISWILTVALVVSNLSFGGTTRAYAAESNYTDISISQAEIESIMGDPMAIGGLDFFLDEAELHNYSGDTAEQILEEISAAIDEGWYLLKTDVVDDKYTYYVLGYKEDDSENLVDNIKMYVVNGGKSQQEFRLHITGDDIKVISGQIEFKQIPEDERTSGKDNSLIVEEEVVHAPAGGGAAGGGGGGAAGGSGSEVESGNDSEADSGNDSEAESGNDSEAESGNDSEAESGNDSEAESGNDNEAESGNDSEAESGNGSEAESGNDNEAESGNDSEAESGNDNEADSGNGSEADGGSDSEAGGGNDSEADSGSGDLSARASISKYYVDLVASSLDGESLKATPSNGIKADDSSSLASSNTAEYGRPPMDLKEEDLIALMQPEANRRQRSRTVTGLGVRLGAGEVGAGTFELQSASQIYELLMETAESYFGENATKQPQGTISFTRRNPSTDKIKPGETATFRLVYSLRAIPTIEYTTSGATAQLFDAYQDTKITLRLPKDFVIQNVPDNYRDAFANPVADGDDYIYTLELGNGGEIIESMTETLDFTVKLAGNGLTPVGTEYEISPEDAKLTTKVDILDKTDDAHEILISYNPEYISQSGNSLTTYTEDVWRVRKTIVDDNKNEPTVDFDIENGLVKIIYWIQVGLDKGNRENEPSTDPGDYNVVGRAPMGTFTLTDTLTATGADGNHVSPTEITVSRWDERAVGEQLYHASGSGTDTFTIGMDQLKTGEGKTNDAQVDSTAPYYTSLKVVALYPSERFKVAFDSADADNEALFPVNNTAEIVYSYQTPDGTTSPDTDMDDAPTKVKLLDEVGTVRIEKYIKELTSNTPVRYTKAMEEKYAGLAGFTITDADGNPIEPSSIRVKKGDKYVPAEQVAVNPVKQDGETAEATNDTGYIDVYLPDGEYLITEDAYPAGTVASEGQQDGIKVTVAAGSQAIAKFINVTNMGAIQFKKVSRGYPDANGNYPAAVPLAGAKFGLWDNVPTNNEDALREAISGSDGAVKFDGLTPGIYYISEISAPGYTVLSTPQRVEVKAGSIATLAATGSASDKNNVYIAAPTGNETFASWHNTKDYARITVEKYIRNYTADGKYSDAKVAGADINNFRFYVEYREEGETTWSRWPNASTTYRLDSTSKFQIEVPTQVDGKARYYRVVESTMPANYTAEGKDVSYDATLNKPVLLINSAKLNPEQALTKALYNVPPASLTLQKYESSISAEGIWSNKAVSGITFELYKKTGDQKFEPVASSKTETSGKITFSNLPMVEGAGTNAKPVAYYLAEVLEDGQDYTLYVQNKKTGTTVNGKTYYGPYTASVSTTTAETFYNVPKKLPFWISKTDSVTGRGISGITFEIYADALKSEAPLETVTTQNGGKTYIYTDKLQAGKTYYVFEKNTPADYYEHEQPGYWTFTMPATPPVHGTVVKQDGFTFSAVNTPIPKIMVEKILVAPDKNYNTRPQDIEFTVYTKTGEETFQPVNDAAGKPVTLQANGAAVRVKELKPGQEYWLKEVLPSNSDIIPVEYLEAIYKAANKEYAKDSDGKMYFKAVVPTGKSKDTTVTILSLNNYKYGALRVTKHSNKDDRKLPGARIRISYQVYEGGKLTTKTMEYVTGTDGAVEFRSLPVYRVNPAGVYERIEYTITETQAPSGYNGTDTTYTTYLIPGEKLIKAVTDPDAFVVADDAAALKFRNEPHFTLKVSKTWINRWNSGFYDKAHALGGTVLALFVQEKNAQDEDVLRFVKEAVTREYDGLATFNELDRTKTYYIFEVSAPEGKYPEGDKAFFPIENYRNGEELRLDANLLTTYNGVKYDGDSEQKNLEMNLGAIQNEEPWVQLHVTKTCDGGENCTHTPNGKEPIDGARFILYELKEIPESGVIPNPNLTEVSDGNWHIANDSYKELAIYESGTRLDPVTHERVPGEFDSHVLEYGKVYVLIETSAAPGYLIGDDARMTVLAPKDSTYSTWDGTTGIAEYEKNDRTELAFTNPHDPGWGEENYLARIKLNKWLNQGTEDVPNYTPLGGVTYRLTQIDKDTKDSQNPTKLNWYLDLTTGLNTVGDNKTGEVMSQYIDFTKLVQDHIVSGTNPDYQEAYFVLEEISAPSGIIKDTQLHRVTIKAVKNAENINSDYYWDGAEGTTPKLVNRLADNYPVTIRKYGYIPTNDTMDMSEAQLDDALTLSTAVVPGSKRPANTGTKVPLEGITFRLEKWDADKSGWSRWDTTDNLITDSNGRVAIQRGLPAGQYRLSENMGDALTKDYHILYPGGTTYREFEVTETGAEIVIMNPVNPLITLNKVKGEANTPVSGTVFTLRDVSNGKVFTGKTGTDGVAVIRVPSGTYRITEVSEPATGTTDTYFGSDTITVGYDIARHTEGKETYLVLNAKTQAAGSVITDDESLIKATYQWETTYKNPQITDLKIVKKDWYTDTVVTDSNAEFKVEFNEFKTTRNSATNSYSVDLSEIPMNGFHTYTYVTPEKRNGVWYYKNVNLGWYRITETKAPTGYSLPQDSKAKVVYIAVVGDMPTTGTLPERTDAMVMSSSNIGAGDNAVEVVIKDKPLVPITVTKNLLVSGNADISVAEKEAALKAISFKVFRQKSGSSSYEPVTMYAAAADGKASATVISRIGVKADTINAAENKADYTAYVVQPEAGETYYLEETIGNTGSRTWYRINADGSLIPTGEKTALETKGDTEAGFTSLTAQVTNMLSEATVTMFKVDMAAPSTGVAGAGFAVYKSLNADGTVNTASVERNAVVVSGSKAGEYKFTVPIPADGAEHAFYIAETNAPEGFVKTDEFITVNLKAGDSITYNPEGLDNLENLNDEAVRSEYLQKLILANARGIDITLEKYDNISGSEEKNLFAGAAFTLYYKTTEGDEWHPYISSKTTGQDGMVTFEKIPVQYDGWQFAISEDASNFGENSSFYGLEGIWEAGGDFIAATPYGDGHIYILDTQKLKSETAAGRKLQLQAYNQRKIELTLAKMDVDGTSNAPRAKFKITKTDETGEVDKNFGTDGVIESWTNASGNNKETTAVIKLEPGFYNVEEIEVSSPYVIMKDHRDVVYLQEKVELTAGMRQERLEFKDVQSGVKPTLAKAVTEKTLDNLFQGPQNVNFTLTPGVNETKGDQPLTSFVVNDTGLNMYNQTTLLGGEYTDEKYTINSVVLKGPGTESFYENKIKGDEANAANQKISATVTFIPFSGENRAVTVELPLDGEISVVPGDTSINYKAFTVSYEDAGLRERTKRTAVYTPDEEFAGYAVGAEFKPGTIEVSMTLHQQPVTVTTGGQTVRAKAVERIVNTAKEDIAYLSWNASGTYSISTGLDSAEAAVTMKAVQAPAAEITKSVTPGASNNVTSNTRLTYTVTLKNVSSETVPLTDPIIYDELPLGVNYQKSTVDTPNGVAWDDGEPKQVKVRRTAGAEVSTHTILQYDFTGALQPDETITVTIEATVDSAIVKLSGNRILNTAYASTKHQGYVFDANPNGAAFRTTNDAWAPSPSAGTVLADAVAEGYIQDYGFIRAEAENNTTKSNLVTLYKDVAGDKMPGDYRAKDEVAQVTNGGWAQYRLFLYNGTTGPVEQLRIADMMPAPDDTDLEGNIAGDGNPRMSKWKMGFAGVTALELEGQTETPSYTVWVTTAEYKTAEAMARKALDGTNSDLDADGWTRWNAWSEDEQKNKALDVTAFVVELDKSAQLESQKTLKIVFDGKVPQYEETSEEFSKNVFQVTVNNFSTYFYDADMQEGSKLTSNTCQVVFEPKDVGVGGHIWIDDNNDGIQNDANHIMDEDVRALLKSQNIKVTLDRKIGTAGSDTAMVQYPDFENGVDMWGTHFLFTGLSPASPINPNDDAALYSWNRTTMSNDLKLSGLYGSRNAKHYTITIDPIKGFEPALKTSWNTGQEAGKSRVPSWLQGSVESEDSNYWKESSGSYRSENFFLWQTEQGEENYDLTKDFGLVRYRNVKFEKHDQSGNALADTKIKIYGPFREGEAKTSDLGNPIYEGTIQTDGTVTAPADSELAGTDGGLKLLYYMEYVVVEEEAPTGYTTEGASAAGNGSQLTQAAAGENSWILPIMKSDKPEVNPAYNVVITNPYKTGGITFSKTDKADENQMIEGAQFTLKWEASDNMQNAQNIWKDYANQFLNASPSNASGVADKEAGRYENGIFDSAADSGNAVRFTTVRGEPVTLKGLPYGSYELTETQAPNGYFALTDKTETVRRFVIDSETQGVLELGSIANERGDFKLKFSKVTEGQSGEPIPLDNITFEVEGPGRFESTWNPFTDGRFKKNDSLNGKGTFTSVNGVLDIGSLYFGDYKISEVADAHTAAYTGVEPFYIRIESDGALTLLTDAGGQVRLNGDSVQLGSEEGVDGFTVVNTLKTGELHLEKVDSETRSKLAGARFELSVKTLAPQEVWTRYLDKVHGSGIVNLEKAGTADNPTLQFTLENGTAVLNQLPYGQYTLKEIKAPEGYVLDPNKPWTETFDIDDAGKGVKHFTDGLLSKNGIVNEKHRTIVYKVDSRNESARLADAEFILQNVDKNQWIVFNNNLEFVRYTDQEAEATTVKSGTDGSFTMKKLPEGTYKLKEIVAPTGYRINSNIDTFRITADSHLEDAAAIVVKDERITYGGSSGGSSGGRTTTIISEDPPLAMLPETNTITIPDEEVPLASLPKVGDRANRLRDITMLAFAMAGLLTMLEKRRKREEEDNV